MAVAAAVDFPRTQKSRRIAANSQYVFSHEIWDMEGCPSSVGGQHISPSVLPIARCVKYGIGISVHF